MNKFKLNENITRTLILLLYLFLFIAGFLLKYITLLLGSFSYFNFSIFELFTFFPNNVIIGFILSISFNSGYILFLFGLLKLFAEKDNIIALNRLINISILGSGLILLINSVSFFLLQIIVDNNFVFFNYGFYTIILLDLLLFTFCVYSHYFFKEDFKRYINRSKRKKDFLNRQNTFELEMENRGLMKRDYIFCSKCGSKNKKEANFCTKCGSKLRSKGENYGKI